MNIRILSPALEDLVAAGDFYERQGEGVGAYFLDKVFVEIDSLAVSGGIHRKQFGHHRLLVERFPYAIYYRIIMSEVVVHRLLDCRQDPGRIRQALQEW